MVPTKRPNNTWEAKARLQGRPYAGTKAETPDTDKGRPKETKSRVTWEAEADLESGLAGFIIERDGAEIARLPEQPAGPFGRPLFQKMSYHDTPEKPLPAMRFKDPAAAPGARPQYGIRAVNRCGLKSTSSQAVPAP